MHIDQRGLPASRESALDDSDEVIGRTRDLLMLRLAKRNMGHRAIAKLFNVGKTTVSRRLQEIPPDVRAYYEKHPLVGMD